MQANLAGVLTNLRQAIGAHGPGGPTDAELLQRFVAQHDHAAFELLVWRHGAMVLQTCRRLLARHEDAEDAFQATFLALVRRAKSIKRGQVVAGWLHTVACRVALRARAAAARRADRERQATAAINGHKPAIDSNGFDPVVWAEVRNLVDQELSRLPTKLRDPFVLCCLEGLTNEEAARQLGCPRGTVLSRLSRARERLRGRLIGRGLGLPAAALTAALCQEAAACLAPAPLVISTVKAAALLAAGQATASVVSAPVAALTEGVLKAMFLTKLKMVVAAVVVAGVVAAGSGGLIQMSTATAQVAQKEPPPKSEPAGKLDPVRAAKAKLHVAAERFHEIEHEMRTLQDRLELLKGAFQKAREEYEAARAALHKPAKGAKPAGDPEPQRSSPPPTLQPKQPPESQLPAEPRPNSPTPPPQNQPAKQPPQFQPPAVDRGGVPLPGGASVDLVHLANSYVDAIRDLETAKVKAGPAKGISQEESAIRVINMKAAERKVELLKAIIEGSLRGAENEYQIARRQLETGIGFLERVNAAQTKVEVLKLILGSAK